MQIEQIPEWSLGKADEIEIAALLARCFDTDFGGRSYFQTRQHLRLIHRRGAIVAHMALQLRAMRLGTRLITVAGLADVATHPDHRGLGLASQLLRAAIEVARTSPAEYLLLFGTAGLYHAAGFRTVINPLIHVEKRGSVTGSVCHVVSEHLMVLPLGPVPWEEGQVLDLLGNRF